MGGSATAVTATAGIGTIGDAQQLQLHRTQKAGQPLSGADSSALTEQGSGSSSELMPLASAMSTAKTAMKSARRTTSMVYQSRTASSKMLRCRALRTGAASCRPHQASSSGSLAKYCFRRLPTWDDRLQENCVFVPPNGTRSGALLGFDDEDQLAPVTLRVRVLQEVE